MCGDTLPMSDYDDDGFESDDSASDRAMSRASAQFLSSSPGRVPSKVADFLGGGHARASSREAPQTPFGRSRERTRKRAEPLFQSLLSSRAIRTWGEAEVLVRPARARTRVLPTTPAAAAAAATHNAVAVAHGAGVAQSPGSGQLPLKLCAPPH